MVLSEYIAVHKAHTNLTSFYTPKNIFRRTTDMLQWTCYFFPLPGFCPLIFLSFVSEEFTDSSGDLTPALHCVAVAGHFHHAMLFFNRNMTKEASELLSCLEWHRLGNTGLEEVAWLSILLASQGPCNFILLISLANLGVAWFCPFFLPLDVFLWYTASSFNLHCS